MQSFAADAAQKRRSANQTLEPLQRATARIQSSTHTERGAKRAHSTDSNERNTTKVCPLMRGRLLHDAKRVTLAVLADYVLVPLLTYFRLQFLPLNSGPPLDSYRRWLKTPTRITTTRAKVKVASGWRSYPEFVLGEQSDMLRIRVNRPSINCSSMVETRDRAMSSGFTLISANNSGSRNTCTRLLQS